MRYNPGRYRSIYRAATRLLHDRTDVGNQCILGIKTKGVPSSSILRSFQPASLNMDSEVDGGKVVDSMELMEITMQDVLRWDARQVEGICEKEDLDLRK